MKFHKYQVILISFDPAISTGYAIFEDGLLIHSGVLIFKQSKKDHQGTRWLTAWDTLDKLVALWKPDKIVYEDVKRHSGTIAAHVYGFISNTILAIAAKHGVPAIGLGVGVWKRSFVGAGNASKDDVADKVASLYPDLVIISNDQTDAIGIGCAFLAAL